MIQIRLKPILSEVLGLPEDLVKILRKELTYELKNAQYMPQPWLGRECLFKSAGAKYTCPTGLIPRVVNEIENYFTKQGKLNHQGHYEILSGMQIWKKNPDLHYFSDQSFTLRPYQVKAAMSLLKSKAGLLGGTIQIATGGGKTIVAIKLIQLMQVKTLYVVHTKDLMYQTIANLTQLLKLPIGQIGDGICTTQTITVATYQSIVQAYEGKKLVGVGEIKQFIENEAQLIVYDECHHAAAKSIQLISKNTKKSVANVGLSASPWRDDGLDLLIESVVGPVTCKITASDLIKMGYLVPAEIHVQFLDAPKNLTPMHYSEAPDEVYAAWIVDSPERHNYVAKLAQEHIQAGESVLILVKSLPHGEILQSIIPGSVFMEGKITSKKRKEIIEKARTGEIKCLIATSLADEGLDLPILSTLILAGAGSSSTRALQRLGRVLRQYPAKGQALLPGTVEKTRARIYDLVDSYSTFRNQFYERQTIYQLEPEFKITKNKVRVYA